MKKRETEEMGAVAPATVVDDSTVNTAETKPAPTYEQLQEMVQQLYNANMQLQQRLNQVQGVEFYKRMDYLFAIVKEDAFNADITLRAVEEITNIMYPPVKEDTGETEK